MKGKQVTETEGAILILIFTLVLMLWMSGSVTNDRNMEIIHHRNEWNWGNSVTCVTDDGYGIATVSFFKDDDTQQLQAVISGVSVHNTHRRLGYGNILLNECEKEAKNNGFTEVSLWCVPNSDAYNWYKRKGYIETNETNESLIRLKKVLK